MAASKKTTAADRTVSIFSGKTALEVAKEEADNSAAEDAEEEGGKKAETTEEASLRWRERAFETAEHLSATFGQALETGAYRITRKQGNLFLEQFRRNGNAGAYGWTGLMFPDGDLYELANVFVKAARAKKEKENGNA